MIINLRFHFYINSIILLYYILYYLKILEKLSDK
jgi:hypothetical protein